jgi:uncharacterized protein
MEVMTSQKLGTRHWTLPSNDLSNPTIVANPPDRCYRCRFTRFDALLEVARAEGLARLVHGENADDTADYRPDRRLSPWQPRCRGVGNPSAPARSRSSQSRGAHTFWDKPANACLAIRFPCSTRLTIEGLARVEAAEDAL